MHSVRERLAPGQYLPVAELSPEVGAAIQAERDNAWGVIENRAALVREGRGDEVPLSLDALSTANSAVEARNTHGIESARYSERWQALYTDTLRLVTEWNRKLKPEVFGELRHHYSQPEEEFYSHGFALGQMTLNALVPIAKSPEETARRVNERVEDRTPLIVQKVGGFALNGVGIRTISECTDQAIEEFESDQESGAEHRGYDGYVPEIEKLMIRDIRIDPETGDRIQEQIGLVGKYSITHYVIQEALRRKGVDASELDKTNLHGLQLIADDSLMDFVMLLDEVASEEWCTPIFMGERVDEDHPRNYDSFKLEAEARQEGLVEMAEKATTFILDLAGEEFDPKKAPGHIEEFVKKLLLGEAKQNIEVAWHAFGEDTANGILEAQALEQAGRYDEAFQKMQEVEKQAPGGGSCSGGSCGLESIDPHSDQGKDLAKRLKADSSDEIVKDSERSCKSCGQKKVVYAYNKSKVNKFCEGCHAFESKKTK